MALLIKPLYGGTQLEFYSIAETGWTNCKNRIAPFAAKKPKYTLLFVQGKLAALASAKLLPDEEQRNQLSETDRVQLKPLGDTCLQNQLDLRGYIRDAYPEAEWKSRYEAAGSTKYEKAAKENWEFVEGMNEEMETFIAANVAALTAPGGMPLTFKQKVEDDADDFTDEYLELKTSRQTGTATAAKISANNACYKDLMEMFKDGVEMVYHNNAEAQKEFTYSVIKDIVSPPGAASLSVTVQLPDDSLAGEGAVSIKKEGSPVIRLLLSAANPLLFASIDVARYDVTIEVPGFPALTISKEVNKGVNARLKVKVG